MDSNNAPRAIPTITVEDTEKPVDKSVHKVPIAEKEREQNHLETQEESSSIPGALPAAPAPVIPEWYVVGWRQSSGIDKPPLAEGEERDKGVLDLFLSEQFYGDWYHNAGIIVFVRSHSTRMCAFPHR